MRPRSSASAAAALLAETRRSTDGSDKADPGPESGSPARKNGGSRSQLIPDRTAPKGCRTAIERGGNTCKYADKARVLKSFGDDALINRRRRFPI